MSARIISVRLDAAWRRALLVVPVAFVVVVAWLGVRWCFADEIAQWVPDRDAALLAERWAPDDPQAQYTLAKMSELTFEPDALAEAAARYERAAALSPNDYRLWLELGRARGLNGDSAGSEAALRRAVALAPTYPEPRWYLGNLLLREGRDEEAFAELRRAGDVSPDVYRPQMFNLAWTVFDGDVRKVLDTVGDSPSARGGFIEYLVGRKYLDDALKLWRALGADAQRAQSASGGRLLGALAEARRYHDALAVERDLLAASDESQLRPSDIAVGQITNGGFESGVSAPGAVLFDWQIAPLPGAQMSLDTRSPHDGARSLRVSFEASDNVNFRNVGQLVAVEPQSRYRLEFYVRTQDLKSASTVMVAVADAADPEHPLAATQTLPLGTADWRQTTLEFSTGAKTEGVVVSVERPACDSPLCPIFGKVWYDDFNLQRLGAPAPSR
ncbi:MAG: carbohydrate binding domain-containing protein [Acidobacteria bacterium]|nr:carbohydrate binding domain-containing protein [Acidobacteriota bacterium]